MMEPVRFCQAKKFMEYSIIHDLAFEFPYLCEPIIVKKKICPVLYLK